MGFVGVYFVEKSTIFLSTNGKKNIFLWREVSLIMQSNKTHDGASVSIASYDSIRFVMCVKMPCNGLFNFEQCFG